MTQQLQQEDERELRENIRLIVEAEITPAEAAQYALGNKGAITAIMIEQLMQLILADRAAQRQQLAVELDAYEKTIFGAIEPRHTFQNSSLNGEWVLSEWRKTRDKILTKESES